MEPTIAAYWGYIAPYMPHSDTVVSIMAIMALLACWPLILLGVLGVLNAICRRKLKAEGWTNEDMAELQRRMLGYVAKNPKEVEELRGWMQIWGGNKVAKPRRIRVMAANVIDFKKWRKQNVEVMEAAE